jgi:SAM-dependent methyltransferase
VSWRWEIVEHDHEIQNPTSAEKIRLLGDYVRLGPESRVLDIACGKAGPAIVLAETYGCRIVGVERLPAFADEARARIAARDLEHLIEVHTGDGAEFPLEPETWDAALCLGASFVWGTIEDAAAQLTPTVKTGGFVAIGEPFWRTWPLPDGIEPESFVAAETCVPLDETIARFRRSGLALTGLIAASEDDWDRYESLHWRAAEEWVARNADDPRAADIRSGQENQREQYVSVRRPHLGWAIFVGQKS